MTTYRPSQQFDSLYTQYQQHVLAIASRTLRRPAEAEDVAQTVWTEAWQAIQSGQTLTKGWLTVCTQRRSWDRREQLSNDPSSLDSLAEAGAETEDGSVLDRLQFAWLSRQPSGLDAAMIERIREAVGQLQPRTAEIITAHYYRGQSVAEIARSLGITSGTVTWHLTTGRNTLRSILAPAESQEAA